MNKVRERDKKKILGADLQETQMSYHEKKVLSTSLTGNWGERNWKKKSVDFIRQAEESAFFSQQCVCPCHNENRPNFVRWLEIVTLQTSTTTNTELIGCRSPWQHQWDFLLLKVSKMPIIKNTVGVIQCFLISNVLKEDELSRFVVGLIGLVLPSVCRRSIRGRSLKIFHWLWRNY